MGLSRPSEHPIQKLVQKIYKTKKPYPFPYSLYLTVYKKDISRHLVLVPNVSVMETVDCTAFFYLHNNLQKIEMLDV